MALSFGVLLIQDEPVDVLLDRARRLDETGVDSVWVADHLAYPPAPDATWWEAWPLLTAIAAATTQIRIGPLVSTFVNHPPLRLARLAATLDTLSGGRLNLGLGAGGAPIDRAACAIPDLDYPALMTRFARGLGELDTLLTGGSIPLDPLPPVAGRVVPPSVALNTPTPQQRHPPYVIGGQGPTTIDLAARWADRWNSWVGPYDGTAFDEARVRNEELFVQRCAAHGRDPSDVTRSLLLDLTPRLRPTSAAALAELVAEMHGLGFDEVIAYGTGMGARPFDELMTFASQHLPALS